MVYYTHDIVFAVQTTEIASLHGNHMRHVLPVASPYLGKNQSVSYVIVCSAENACGNIMHIYRSIMVVWCTEDATCLCGLSESVCINHMQSGFPVAKRQCVHRI